MNEICNVKLVGNSDLPLFGFHTNPHQESETFGFLQSRKYGSLSRKTQNILTWNFLEGKHKLKWPTHREDLKRCDATRKTGQQNWAVMCGENQIGYTEFFLGKN